MRILIIEDEKVIANTLKTGLVTEKFAVDVAYTGNDGYDLAAVEEYDVIVLDLMLPGLDGLSICRRLRDKNIKTPILMLTAKDTTEDKVSGLNLGADDYLIKPFSFEELLARIRSLIRRTHSQNITLKVGTLELDPISHIVKRSSRKIELTAKEYSLLEYLMNNAGHVVTREQILTHVWDYSYEGVSNTVDVIIKRLREKIDKAFPQEQPLLSTQRGLGYKIGN